MKKTFILLGTLLLFTAMAVAGPVGRQKAQQAAMNAVCQYIASQHAVKADDCQLKECENTGFAHLHLFNYTLGGYNGFVVVSGDDAAMPILAISDEGTLEVDKMSPSCRYWLEHYDRQIAASQRQGVQAESMVAEQWWRLTTVNDTKESADTGFYGAQIAPLLGEMKWNQKDPYNRLCPSYRGKKAVTGCVATAFGMIMNRWNWPEHGWGQHSYDGRDNPTAYPKWKYGTLSANFQETYYDWEHIYDNYGNGLADSVVLPMATLLFHLGVALDMKYSPDGSGCWSLPEYAIFDTSLHLDPKVGADYRIPKYFGYKYTYAGMRDSIGDDTTWLRMLYTSLADSMPIYYAGWSVDTTDPSGHSGTSGHGFVLDGYKVMYDTNVLQYNILFHINWGWGGYADGDFALDAMKPAGLDFTQWHGAIIGLQPDSNYHGETALAIRQPVQEDYIVYDGGGRIVVRGAGDRSIEIYDLSGRCVAWSGARPGDNWDCHVCRGMYVVAVGNSTKKILILE